MQLKENIRNGQDCFWNIYVCFIVVKQRHFGNCYWDNFKILERKMIYIDIKSNAKKPTIIIKTLLSRFEMNYLEFFY